MSLLEVDPGQWMTSYAHAPMPVAHHLANDPLLTLETLAQLADALPPKSIEHSVPDVPIVLAQGTPALSQENAGDIVRTLDERRSWVVLWNIEQVPEYRNLLDACLDEVLPLVRRFEDMGRREGFVFLSCARSVTPSHCDPEHNVLLQIRGEKEMVVGRYPDPYRQTEAIEPKYKGAHRNLPFEPAAPVTFRLFPGDGVYVPTRAPHMVRVGDQLAVSLSITFRSPGTERDDLVYQFNARLRHMGVRPRAPGDRAAVDRIKANLERGLTKVTGRSG